MKKTIVVITQVLIFIAAWALESPDTLVDNTYVFGLIGSYDLVRGNAHWVLLGAAVASVLNILIWWPKAAKQTVAAAEGVNTKSAEAKEIDRDPKTPDLS